MRQVSAVKAASNKPTSATPCSLQDQDLGPQQQHARPEPSPPPTHPSSPDPGLPALPYTPFPPGSASGFASNCLLSEAAGTPPLSTPLAIGLQPDAGRVSAYYKDIQQGGRRRAKGRRLKSLKLRTQRCIDRINWWPVGAGINYTSNNRFGSEKGHIYLETCSWEAREARTARLLDAACYIQYRAAGRRSRRG